MRKFVTLQCNGRARVALTMALLIPPMVMAVLPMFDFELDDAATVLPLWGALMVLVVMATYALVGVARLLGWMRRGLSDAEREALVLVRRLVFGVALVLAGFAIAPLFRYEIIPIAFASGYYKYDRFTGEVTRARVVKETTRVVTVGQPGI